MRDREGGRIKVGDTCVRVADLCAASIQRQTGRTPQSCFSDCSLSFHMSQSAVHLVHKKERRAERWRNREGKGIEREKETSTSTTLEQAMPSCHGSGVSLVSVGTSESCCSSTLPPGERERERERESLAQGTRADLENTICLFICLSVNHSLTSYSLN